MKRETFIVNRMNRDKLLDISILPFKKLSFLLQRA